MLLNRGAAGTSRAEYGMTIARHRLRAALAGLVSAATAVTIALAGCGTDASSGSSAGTSATITIWEGYQATEGKVFAHLISEYEAQHPGQKVQTLYVNSDDALQKVL